MYERVFTFTFENLNVYHCARQLVKQIYILQRKFPKEEMYALGDQIRRSASSIISNIAEGSGRESFKEKVRFIEIAFGSMTEAFSQLIIAQDLGYITEQEVNELRPLFNEVSKMLSGLRSSFMQKIE